MHDEFEDNEIEYVSKSQLKRDMHAMQELALELTKLKAEQLAKLPLTPKLEEALQETHNIKKREALRRHRQYLGRVMRDADHEAIALALTDIKGRSDRLARLQPMIEQWRDDLLTDDKTVLARFISEFPSIDRQHLRQLVHNAVKEKSSTEKKKTGASRKLYTLIKEHFAQNIP